MLRRILLLCVLTLGLCAPVFAQQEDTSTAAVTPELQPQPRLRDTSAAGMMMDSIAEAMKVRQRFVADSVSTQFIRHPDSTLVNQFSQYIFAHVLYQDKGRGFLDISPKTGGGLVREGTARHQRAPWSIAVVIGLAIYMCLLNLLMGKDVETVLNSFYDRRAAQSGKEESLLNSQTFVAMFVLFGLASGLFIYQVSAAYDKYYSVSGFQLFLMLSIGIVALFALKLLVLRFIGFVFNVNRVVSDYIAILYLTYFNIALVFLPITLCFCLLPDSMSKYIINIALVLIVLIFIWQYLRSSVNIISNFRFHKFYLFIYLCALEICPVLILVKALNI
ncbi:uncharacterized protein DUF4271 [Mucilaginibacter yixingensis]|uniref:Uncharacterized protein DUF4271 n=1 Tax=Mucilaginibacter yixingensis TaxID=1295612 RepID=A0A2T5J7I6_9SPHI|nr:DUF4271 domain-containing protein [Mucilaginibacter yixingensis]PTQ95069.1 uncharacterized protein DUF4271 [Mucilaginibacter yixingensis]